MGECQSKPFDLDGDLGQPQGLSPLGIRRLVELEIARSGRSAWQWCLDNNIPHSVEVYELLRGLRYPSASILRALGYEKQYVYTKVKVKRDPLDDRHSADILEQQFPTTSD